MMEGDFDNSIEMTLHLLRNPSGWDPEVLHRARILAAAIIEESLFEIRSQAGKGKKAARYKDALERIAQTTGSDDPCRWYVDIARAALRDEQ